MFFDSEITDFTAKAKPRINIFLLDKNKGEFLIFKVYRYSINGTIICSN